MALLAVSVLAASLVAAAVPSAPRPPAARDPVTLLQEGRRLHGGDGGSFLDSIRKRSPLWSARVSLARAASGEEGLLPVGPALGLAGVDEFLRLRNDPRADAGALIRFAASAPTAPLAVEAVGEASLRIHDAPDRRLVRDAAVRLLSAGKGGPRTATTLLLARFRAEAAEAERRAAMAALSAAVPDAPERAPGLFRGEEALLFRSAAMRAPLPARISRARALLAVRPDESASLVQRGTEGASPEEAFGAAEILLATGRARDCSRLLGGLERGGSPVISESARALSTAAALQLGSGGERPRKTGRASRKGSRPGSSPRAAKPAKTFEGDLDRLARDAEGILGKELLPQARQRLLLELLRAGRRADLVDLIRSAAKGLVELDPAGSAGGEELFQAAFASYRSGNPEAVAASARAFREIASLYRNVSVRRRAVYWEARALQQGGDPAAAALFASLLPGTSPDLYGRWSADLLGVDPPAAAPPLEPEVPASAELPAAPSREYLAAGLDGLAELSAEAEGSLDRLFSARIASERGEYRRAISALKALHPELGTPEEGGVSPDERRLFYPLAHFRVVEEEALRSGLSPALLCGLIRQESLFQDRIVSKAGAVGLMQVMPATGKLLLRREGGRGRLDLSLPGENVRLGSQFFGSLLSAFDGDVAAALAAYNAGPSRAARWKKERADLSPDEWVESIPFSETREYVKRVLYFSGAYAAIYGLPDPPGPARLSSGGAALGPAVRRPAAAPAGPSRPSGGR